MASKLTNSPNKKELTEEAIDHIMWLTSQIDTRDQFECTVLLITTTDLCSSEILALTWADIDWEGATAHVERANMYARGVVPAKVKREVELPPVALDALRELRAAQGKRLSTYWKHLAIVEDGAKVAAPDVPIVCSLKGFHIPPRKLADWWYQKACEFDMFGWSLPDLSRAQKLMAAIGIEVGR